MNNQTTQKHPLGCLKITYQPQLELVKNRFKKELTYNKSKNKGYSSYLYGFQGQERDDEIKGSGNSYNYTYRMHDPRLGRWLSVDPLFRKYPSMTVYNSMGNNPIIMVDVQGTDIWYFYEDGTWAYEKTDGGNKYYTVDASGVASDMFTFSNMMLGIIPFVNDPVDNLYDEFHSRPLARSLLAQVDPYTDGLLTALGYYYVFDFVVTAVSVVAELPSLIKASYKGGRALLTYYRAATSSKKALTTTFSLSKAVLTAACFEKGTKIKTIDGYKNIEEIKIGDYVLSYDVLGNETTFKKVDNLYVSTVNKLVNLVIDSSSINVTIEHPFYTTNGWKKAGLLTLNDSVFSFNKFIPINKILHLAVEDFEVYNFSVEDFHTYFVSYLDILVHNKCGFGVAHIDDVKKWVSYEKGAQSVEKVEDFKKSLKNGDIWVWNEPIYTTTKNGVTHILDGNHRINAALEMGYDGIIPYVNLSKEESIAKFGDKAKEIWNK